MRSRGTARLNEDVAADIETKIKQKLGIGQPKAEAERPTGARDERARGVARD